MICYVFDLDDTLLQTNKIKPNSEYSKYFIGGGKAQTVKEYYDLMIPSEPFINRMLSVLKGPKLILTNSSGNHAKYSLEAMKINNNFFHIINANVMNFINKPHPNAYMKTENIVKNISPYTMWKFVFFDDLVENLISSKRLGWITVLINSNYQNIPKERLLGIDYMFKDIYTALNYFVNIQQQNLKM